MYSTAILCIFVEPLNNEHISMPRRSLMMKFSNRSQLRGDELNKHRTSGVASMISVVNNADFHC